MVQAYSQGGGTQLGSLEEAGGSREELQMRHRAWIVTGATIVAVMLATISAAGPTAYKKGFYKGKTSQDNPVEMTFLKGSVENASVTIGYSCSDGSEEASIPFELGDGKVSKKGKFSLAWAEFGTNALLTLEGKVKGKKAKGTLRFSASLPNGVHCSVDDVTWKAKKK
jgi:hypothetical protein